MQQYFFFVQLVTKTLFGAMKFLRFFLMVIDKTFSPRVLGDFENLPWGLIKVREGFRAIHIFLNLNEVRQDKEVKIKNYRIAIGLNRMNEGWVPMWFWEAFHVLVCTYTPTWRLLECGARCVKERSYRCFSYLWINFIQRWVSWVRFTCGVFNENYLKSLKITQFYCAIKEI